MQDSFDLNEFSIYLRNNIPIDDFLGLTPAEVHYLLYDTFSSDSPVQLRNDIDDNTLDQIPLFRIAEEYLKIVQRNKEIKLTPLGALPQKIVIELYNKKFLLHESYETGSIKLYSEQYLRTILSARLTVEIAGLTKKTNNKITLTKQGANLLETNNRLQIFKTFFEAFTNKFFWGFNDRYADDYIGQLGWAFSVILLNKFGDKPRTTKFYTEKYLKAFPYFANQYKHTGLMKPEDAINHCYSVRTFERFFLWFGFVVVNKQKNFLQIETDTFQKTSLIESVFKIKEL